MLGDRMNKLYMGIDVGSSSAKGVIIDIYDNIIASDYVNIEGDIQAAVKRLINRLKIKIDLVKYKIVSIGVTGSSKKLIGTMLDANIVKNEVMATSVGVVKMYPEVKTIFEMGGQDGKVILVNKGIVTDYAINSSCSCGCGMFINSLAKRLNVRIDDIAKEVLKSENKVDIASRCIVFAEADLINKLQNGYSREDILASVCRMVAKNYVNNVIKGKKIKTPIVFTGGVSKNIAVVKELGELLGEKIIVNKNSHLMGAYGIAIMARDSKSEKEIDLDMDKISIETKITNCSKCDNNCVIVNIYRNNKLIDCWGNKCNNIMVNE